MSDPLDQLIENSGISPATVDSEHCFVKLPITFVEGFKDDGQHFSELKIQRVSFWYSQALLSTFSKKNISLTS